MLSPTLLSRPRGILLGCLLSFCLPAALVAQAPAPAPAAPPAAAVPATPPKGTPSDASPSAAVSPPAPVVPAIPLRHARNFMYQMQEIEETDSTDLLAKSAYDLLIVEPTFTLNEEKEFEAKELVEQLKAGRPGRIVLACIDIGEAERDRVYYQPEWKAPTGHVRGSPDFLLTPEAGHEADGGPVAFWDPKWHEIWLGPEGLVKQILDAGFDGFCLAGVEQYQDDVVEAEARRQRKSPAREMLSFITQLRTRARQVQPHAVLIVQNAPSLIEEDPHYATMVDGVLMENTWFSGDGDAEWDDPKGGDVPNTSKDPEESTEGLLKVIEKYRRAGLPVFTLDYCLKPANAAKVYAAARWAGVVPLVTRAALDRLTTTPPPGVPLPPPPPVAPKASPAPEAAASPR